MQKLYIVQKYIWAASASDALKRERTFQPDEVFIDVKWRENQDKHPETLGYNKTVNKGKRKKKA